MIEFSMVTFLSLDGERLYEYVAEVERSGWKGMSQETVRELLMRLSKVPEIHAIYIICWAAERRLTGTADAAIEFLRRFESSPGGRYTVMRALGDAPDLAARHLIELETLAADNPDFALSYGLKELKERRGLRGP